MYVDFVLHRVTMQAGHEAWNALIGNQHAGTAPGITREDTSSNAAGASVPLSNSHPDTLPPNGPQITLTLFVAWLLKHALPAGNGGVGQ